MMRERYLFEIDLGNSTTITWLHGDKHIQINVNGTAIGVAVGTIPELRKALGAIHRKINLMTRD